MEPGTASSNGNAYLPFLKSCGAAVLLMGGVWLSAAFIFGFGVVDSWIIYPPSITPLHWCIPLALIGPAGWWLFRPILKSGQITLRQVFWSFLVLSILSALIAPIYTKYREREAYYRRLESPLSESSGKP